MIGTESAEDPELYGQGVSEGRTENPRCSFDSRVPAENTAVDNSLVDDIWAQKTSGSIIYVAGQDHTKTARTNGLTDLRTCQKHFSSPNFVLGKVGLQFTT